MLTINPLHMGLDNHLQAALKLNRKYEKYSNIRIKMIKEEVPSNDQNDGLSILKLKRFLIHAWNPNSFTL